jgi:endoglucanase
MLYTSIHFKISKSAFILTLLLISASLNAQSPAHDRCAAFGKGQNISNWLEAYWQGNWPSANGYTKKDLEDMKAAGSSSIRLPIAFSAIVDTVAPYYVDTAHVLFSRIDSVIKWSDELGLNLIIDNHHGWTLSNQAWRHQLYRFAHLWSAVSARYSYLDPERYTFELLNEPAIGFDLDSLNIMFNTAIDSIRQHTTAHSIIVSPHFGSVGLAFNNYVPLADTNLIYTFHCYDPQNFTHQGFSWTSPPFPAGQLFPDYANFFEPPLYQSWNIVRNWKTQYNLPVFLGEFGVSNHADATSKCKWIEYIATNLVQMDMPWFYWDWRYDFAMFSSATPNADSIIPCIGYYLGLYGDTTFNSVAALIEKKNVANLTPTLLTKGEACRVQFATSGYYTIEVLDMHGKLLTKHTSTEPEQHIPMPYQSGIYFLRIQNGREVQTSKVMICD